MFKFSWISGLALVVLLGVPRFWIVLKANEYGDYRYTAAIFIVMVFLPFVLLKKEGRKQIGWVKAKEPRYVLRGFLIGILLSSVGYLVGHLIFQDSISNWFVYISKSYSVPEVLDVTSRFKYFILFAFMSMLFSPFGEELMYRGMIHQSFVDRFGQNTASQIDSLAFGLTHLAHFGIVFTATGWDFLIIPSLMWVALMFFCSRIFFLMKIKSGSLFGAISTHAGFNFGMTFWIFYFIL